jgi:thioesterase domain-containing protein
VTSLELQSYLYQHIPLTRAMQVTVMQASTEGVVLGAPLGPNINHLGTAFGGSASALAITAAWAQLHTLLAVLGDRSRVLIQRNTMNYERPIEGDFLAVARPPAQEPWDLFLKTLRRKGRARITLSSVLWFDGREAGHFEGDFVALAERLT